METKFRDKLLYFALLNVALELLSMCVDKDLKLLVAEHGRSAFSAAFSVDFSLKRC